MNTLCTIHRNDIVNTIVYLHGNYGVNFEGVLNG